MNIRPWLTAIHRRSISKPMDSLIQQNFISKDDIILDFGCGHGKDVEILNALDFNIVGYDKYITPFCDTNYIDNSYTKISCLYVLNTIADNSERIGVIKHLLSLLDDNGSIFFAVRSIDEFEREKHKHLTYYKDGVVTSRSTFQKYFSKEDITTLIHDNFTNISLEYIPFNKYTLLFKLERID